MDYKIVGASSLKFAKEKEVKAKKSHPAMLASMKPGEAMVLTNKEKVGGNVAAVVINSWEGRKVFYYQRIDADTWALIRADDPPEPAKG